MALTASEEALVRQLLDQQAAILSLAGNEATITSKLGATKVTLADLVAASSLADADLLLTRQGTTDKSVRADILAAYMASELNLSLFAPLSNPTFTGDPKAPTAAQFDNDTSLATTAFVQQTIGNLRPFQVITASGTLASSSVGRITQLAATSTLTVTMPKANTVPSGSALTLVVSGTESATLAAQSGDTFTFLSRPELMPGESIVLVSNGVDSWWRATGSESEAPPGTVIYVARNSLPLGYLKANGAAISRSTYSRLFAEIGTTFGAGNGSTTFNLPDLRGEFIRGFDDGRGVDSGRVFGSSQSDDLKAHTHTAAGTVYSLAFLAAGSGRDFQNATVTTSSTGGAETRPRNVALLACIKY